jgi:hypothetical protein
LRQSIGRPLPEETTIGIDLGYATCVFAIPDDASTDWKGVMTFGQAPQNSRGGLMLPLEGNRWMATIGGRHGDVPSGDAEGFLTYARALRTPTIFNAMVKRRAETPVRPSQPAIQFGRSSNWGRHDGECRSGRSIAALMFFLASSAVFSDDMSGHADIIDRDTLEIHGTRYRLWRIDAPESNQLRRGGR